jgi:hypothetical protein
MRSRAFFFTATTLIGIALIAGAVYLWRSIRSEPSKRPAAQERTHAIRINKTVQGAATAIMAGAGIATVKDASGKEITLAIVPETKIVDEKNADADITAIQNGSLLEGRGESVAQNAMIVSEIRIVKAPEIVVSIPAKNMPVTSPLTIEGMAKGTWYFEANLPVEIVDAQRRSLGKKFVTATKDWMSESLVPFAGQLEFQKPDTKTGYLIFKNDNPSGSKENEKTFEIPIDFQPATMTVNVFFNNSNLDPAFLCDKVFPISREIAWTEGTARAAIEELLKGPSDPERSMNYFSNIDPNVKINDIAIADGTARVDFSDALGRNTAGSCRVTAIRSQITATLEQFPTVKNVTISINGKVDDMLQP